jgi:hypothetical protein
VIAAALVAIVASGCGKSSEKKEAEADADADASASVAAPASACTEPPAPVPSVTLPTDPPLPPGSYGVASGPGTVTFVVSGTPRDFARFVVTNWPKAGWQLGRGDSEANEAEDSFSKGKTIGSFKARSGWCGHSEVLLHLTNS